MPTPIIKLQTNVPLVGTISKVWYAKSKTEGYSDQLRLVGTFAGHGEVSVYVHLSLENDLRNLGIITAQGQDRDGNQAYQVVRAALVQILKNEEGTKRFTTITLADAAPTVQSNVPGISTVPPKAGNLAAAVQHVVTQAKVATEPGDAFEAEPNKNELAWSRFRATYQQIVEIVTDTWPDDTPPEVIGTQVSTLSISARQEGLWVQPE